MFNAILRISENNDKNHHGYIHPERARDDIFEDYLPLPFL